MSDEPGDSVDPSLRRGRGSLLTGLRWTLAGQGGAQALRALTSLVLASMLGPEAFGLMAIALAVIAFADMLIDLGSGQALIQRRELSKPLVDSVFTLNVLVGLGFSAALLIAAPAASRIYKDPQLVPVLQVICLAFPISSAGVVHRAMLVRRMQLDRLAGIQMFSVVSTGVVSISLARLGYGVWSLVWGTLIGLLFTTFALWWATRLRPSLSISREELRSISGFSRNLTYSNLLTYLVGQADKLVLGAVLGSVSLGFYSLAERLVQRPVQMIGVAVDGAVFSRFSEWQDQNEALRRGFLRAATGIALVVWPTVAGLAALASELVVYLGSEWTPAAAVLVLLAPSYAITSSLTRPIGLTLRAKGRTDLLLRWRLIETPVLVISYLAAIPFGLHGVCIALTLSRLAITVPYLKVLARLIDLHMLDVPRSLTDVAAATVAMLIGVLTLPLILPEVVPHMLRIALQVVVGALVYGGVVWMLRRELLLDVLRLMGLRGGAMSGVSAGSAASRTPRS